MTEHPHSPASEPTDDPDRGWSGDQVIPDRGAQQPTNDPNAGWSGEQVPP